MDYALRKVTLKDEAGKVRVVKAGSDIQNLNRLKIGDTVTVQTFQTVSGEVKPGEGEPMNISAEGQTAPLPGEKPSGIRTIEGTLRTRIESIDQAKRTVSFKGRSGILVTYQIGPEAQRFSEDPPRRHALGRIFANHQDDRAVNGLFSGKARYASSRGAPVVCGSNGHAVHGLSRPSACR